MKFQPLRYVDETVALKHLTDVHALVRRTGREVSDPSIRDRCLK
jgi:hypothetical protein